MESYKILVISDSHGNRSSIEKALETAGKVDALFHLGDYTSDMDGLDLRIPVLRVAGGPRDTAMGDAELLEIVLGGKRIVAVHGQNHGVMFSLRRLTKLAEGREADLALFGHTHVPLIRQAGKALLLNPGSAIMPRGKEKAPSFALVEIANGELGAKIIYMES